MPDPCGANPRRKWTLFWWLPALAVAWPQAAVSADPTSGAALLQARGLRRSGYSWQTPQEQSVRSRIASVRKLRRTFIEAGKQLQAAKTQNAAALAQVQRLKREMQQLEQLLDGGNFQQAQRARLTAEYNKRADAYNALGPRVYDAATRTENPALRQAVIRYAEARSALALALLYVKRHAADVAPSYARLRDDDDVAAALKSEGDKHQLGPAKDYVRESNRLARLGEDVFTADAPVYLSNRRFHVCTIVNEQAPITFTYAPQEEASYLAASNLQSAGIRVPDDAPRSTVRLGGRTLQVREITVPAIRFGKLVLEDVAMFAMPPEAADLGSALGSAALEPLKIDFDAQQLQFRVTPASADTRGPGNRRAG